MESSRSGVPSTWLSDFKARAKRWASSIYSLHRIAGKRAADGAHGLTTTLLLLLSVVTGVVSAHAGDVDFMVRVNHAAAAATLCWHQVRRQNGTELIGLEGFVVVVVKA